MDDIFSMRYAHSDGHTDICYNDSGKYLVTCGNDGDIRIYDGFEDDDPQSHHMGDIVSAVAIKKNMLYLSSDNFAVSAYSFPEAEFDQIIAQFNTAVYHIVCSKDGKFVACGGGDFIIKVYNTSTKELTAFIGHGGPVLSIAFDPKEKYLASAGCDGTVRLWQLSDQECIKTLNLFKKSNDLCTSSTLCRIDWSSDGQLLAVPLETKICFYQRDSWVSKFSLTDECIVKTLSIATFSPFGKYIAASAMNGQMLVWDVETLKCVSKKLHEKEIAVCGLTWNPSGNELAFCDVEGQMGIYSSPLNSSGDEANINEDVPLPTDNGMDTFEDDDDENAFDIGAIKASLEPKIFGSADNESNEPVKSDPEPKIQYIEAPKAPVQKAFQPSSTSVNFERRFMLWNDVGIVRSYNTEEENSIDVEFHDANVYHPLHLNNSRNHTLAALSTEALLLASPKSDDSSRFCGFFQKAVLKELIKCDAKFNFKLECLHFSTWDSNKEWTVEMPKDEDIEAITLGDGYAVCVTDKKFVRLFTIGGIQCEIFLLPGPVVCCAARGSQLLVVYHKGLGVENDQCLNIMLVKVKLGGHCSMKEYFLPLTSRAFLSWLGYTDEGNPCIVDTSGIISLLSTSCGTKWTPIANTTSNSKGKSDTYFVIGLSEIKQEIRCILCKGLRYPALLPKPTIAVLPFSLPFCEMSTDKGKLEEENARYSLAYKRTEALLKDGFDLDSELKSVEKKWMDVLLKMFALATRSDREYRALDVAELMPNPIIVQGAIRYATQRHRIALAERLGEVMNKKLNKDVEDDDFELPAYEDLSESQVSRNASLSNSLNSFSKDDTVLKPKPLSMIRNQINKAVENSDEDETSVADSKVDRLPSSKELSLIPKSSPLTNPFKANFKAQAKKEDLGNTNGIDEMLNNSMKSVYARNSSSSISTEKVSRPKKSRLQFTKDYSQKTTTNGISETRKFGFDLFLEENKEKINSTNPDMADKELIKIAMKLFKELPKAEKQKYEKNTNSNTLQESLAKKNMNPSSKSYDSNSNIKENSSQDQPNSVKEPSEKRACDDDDDTTPKPKKVKSNQDKCSDTTVRKLTQFAFTKTPK